MYQTSNVLAKTVHHIATCCRLRATMGMKGVTLLYLLGKYEDRSDPRHKLTCIIHQLVFILNNSNNNNFFCANILEDQA